MIVQSGMLDSQWSGRGDKGDTGGVNGQGHERLSVALGTMILGSEFLAPVEHFQIVLDEGADAWHMSPSRGGCLVHEIDEYILPIFANLPPK